jgi:hypothetical protein
MATKQKRIQQDTMTAEQLRQLYIIRQSQMKTALDYYIMRGITPTLLEWALTAEHLTYFIHFGIDMEFVQASNRMEVHFADGELKVGEQV